MHREFRIQVGSTKYEEVDLNQFSQTVIERRQAGVPARTIGEVATELNLSKCKFRQGDGEDLRLLTKERHVVHIQGSGDDVDQ